jgi:hypothetical protein
MINEHEGARRPGSSLLCGGGKARDFLLGVESFPQLLTVFGGAEEVTSRAEVLHDGTIRREEAVGVTGGFEPLHAPFALARRLMGVLGAIIEIAVLPMFHARQELSLGGSITLQLIRDDDPRSILASFEELAEEFLRGLLVPPALHQDIEDVAVLIDRPPEIMMVTLDCQKDLIQMPLITSLGTPAPQLIGIRLAELPAPLPDGFVRHHDPAGEQELFDITVAEAEPVVQPHAMADDLGWKPMMFV